MYFERCSRNFGFSLKAIRKIKTRNSFPKIYSTKIAKWKNEINVFKCCKVTGSSHFYALLLKGGETEEEGEKGRTETQERDEWTYKYIWKRELPWLDHRKNSDLAWGKLEEEGKEAVRSGKHSWGQWPYKSSCKFGYFWEQEDVVVKIMPRHGHKWRHMVIQFKKYRKPF